VLMLRISSNLSELLGGTLVKTIERSASYRSHGLSVDEKTMGPGDCRDVESTERQGWHGEDLVPGQRSS
jgi:hypothetical protein